MIMYLFVLFPGISAANNNVDIQTFKVELQALLTNPLNNQLKPAVDYPQLLEFYQPRDFYPAWVNHEGIIEQAKIFRNALHVADQHGLTINDYHLQSIDSLWSARNTTQLARLEILLTDAFLRYSLHLRAGQYHENDFFWDIESPDVNPVSELRYLLTVDDFNGALQALAPYHDGYQRLREALSFYKTLEKERKWPVIPDGPSLTLGSWNPQVAIIRQRLLTEADLELGPVTNPEFFDEAMKFAVERFQVRHGLKMDGIVGRQTRAAMNVTVSQRIKQIQYNMERWRWLPKQLGQRYIMVNTAGFNLTVVDNDEIRFTMGVIIGQPDRPTPVTSSTLHTVVFNPYWTVPPTIIAEDFLPRQQRDPGFFESKHIRVYANGKEVNPQEIDWSRVTPEQFPYILRQDPGPHNSLGRLKFLFSNAYTVYLHDTPGKHLFDKDSRAFSSGCIRVEKPLQLASYLLGEENGWDMDKIKATIESGDYLEAAIPRSIPIYLVYMTAWVGKNNGVHFRPDIYGRDPGGAKCDELPLN